jgi:hypothetical protein
MNINVGPILILSDEPVVAALVGLLIELTGREPVFPDANESAADAVERLRPLAVVLVDCAYAAARSDVFFALAAQKRLAVAVFGPDAKARDIGEIAARRSIPWLVLPPAGDDVALAIMSAAEPSRSRRVTERRTGGELTIFADGTPVFSDGDGRRWIVYDRRSAQNRRADETDRTFVALDGERRRLVLDGPDAASPTAALLAEQLRRATLG